MHGAPTLAPDFSHVPYVNPDAPRGGRIRIGETGGFDSLNPWILKGRSPWAIRGHMFESLLGRNWDEPFALYGLLAESVETPEDRSSVTFTLREAARFSDGSPVTVEDVLWSFEVLAEKGLPGFRSSWKKVARAYQTGENSLKVEFNAPDRELPLILGLRPIMQKARFEGLDFADSTMEPLITSGPYLVAEAEPNRRIVFRRDPNWWGRDLPFNRGKHLIDEVAYEFFKDDNVRFEAFKAGDLSVFRDGEPARWAEGYGFPAALDGQVVKSEVPHQRPTGMTGFVFNGRRDVFKDIDVRRALLLAFDFEWVNRTMNRGAYARIPSYFGNSPLAWSGPAEGRERALLDPFADTLPPGTLEGAYEAPETAGDGRNRRNLRKARLLLEGAGWRVEDGVLRNADGDAFAFEILLRSGAFERAASVFADALKPLGIDAVIRSVDSSEYQARKDAYDFDMIVNRWALSLSPGNEQRLYWGREGVTSEGTRNYMGVDSPAIEAAIDALLTAEGMEDFQAAARAIDRVLTHGVHVIPLWYAPSSWIAHRANVRFPDRTPLYGDWVGFLPDVWWVE